MTQPTLSLCPFLLVFFGPFDGRLLRNVKRKEADGVDVVQGHVVQNDGVSLYGGIHARWVRVAFVADLFCEIRQFQPARNLQLKRIDGLLREFPVGPCYVDVAQQVRVPFGVCVQEFRFEKVNVTKHDSP